ncbi:acyl transferase/acyl hydrolase/lysophospholipase [Cokeromyces recurvatus]|uniref:acyl transferase/acyl hydrolase/lysophospholipase n=1 Tax=Cokeromyces recurvatus TaxID=90255 RepID=UPI00221F1FC3|nr:acyl transferase/acyl hydrolase/lysophospholipase [Cokeromyces recurvatus]KAI7907337.1 acyl transferase/acyl hydrolase/lysophospholipase [Cokeromyces recurvatus]
MNTEEQKVILPESLVWTSLLPTGICNRIKLNQSKAYYENLLKLATNYEEWCEAASMLDKIEGLDKWRTIMESPDYDWELIKTRLDQLREIRFSNKGQLAMIFALRTSLARNLGDMGNPKLYAYSRVGTKDLTSDYIEEVVQQLNWICDEEEEDSTLDLKARHDFFMNIRQSFGRTALLLSGGGTLGLNHMGVIKCLHEAQLLPRIISGASSGSIMAALVCTKTNDEIPYMFDASVVRLDVFEREGKPDLPYIRLLRLMKQGQLFDVEILKEAMRANLGDITFQEAFNRTRFILNITVSSSTLYDMPRLLNYLTAPDVLIWSAVAASCAVPVFYGSTPLYSKDKNGKISTWNPSDQLYIDGSVENDLPMNKLSELFNVNHFIVCQVNPHVIPFLQKTITPSRFRRVANFCMHMAKTEAQHRCTQLTELGIMPSFFYKIQSIMSQKYSGDITIIPEIGYADFLKVLSNPTPDYVMDCVQRGERATWPKMPIIKNHLQIELTIDKILYRLRLRRLSEIQRQQSLFLTPTTTTTIKKHYSSGRPMLETRSTSQLNVRHHMTLMSPIDEQGYDEFSPLCPPKRLDATTTTLDVMVQTSQSTPMFFATTTDQLISSDHKESQKHHETNRRKRNSTKRGLLMTKPE